MKILLTDDHDIIIKGIESFIKTKFPVSKVFQANNISSASEIIEHYNISLLITDISMPTCKDGLGIIELAQKADPETKVIVFSMHTENWLINKLLNLKINGFVSKSSDINEIAIAIEEVVAGKRYFCPYIQEVIFSGTTNLSHPIVLTNREKDIIKLIMEEKNTSQIARKLRISKNTVETHRKNIMLKLEVNNVAGLVKMVIERGLV